jgi:hypothetical protein
MVTTAPTLVHTTKAPSSVLSHVIVANLTDFSSKASKVLKAKSAKGKQFKGSSDHHPAKMMQSKSYKKPGYYSEDSIWNSGGGKVVRMSDEYW